MSKPWPWNVPQAPTETATSTGPSMQDMRLAIRERDHALGDLRAEVERLRAGLKELTRGYYPEVAGQIAQDVLDGKPIKIRPPE